MREQLAGDIVWLGGGLLYGWLICALAQLAALGPARACRAAASVRGRTGCALCKLPPREYSAAAAICFALLLIVPPGSTALSYDAVVHAIAIGFVLSMIFGHAPIILPAITGLRVRYHAAAYLPLLLLHLSVLLRVAADLLERADLHTVSGPVTVLALAGYAASLIVASRK